MIKKIKIYDLDGTLIDSSHRYRTKNGAIDLQHWRENDTRKNVLENDTFLDLYEWLKVDLKRNDTFVIFATARACTYNDHNYEFLKNNDIVPDMFIHRMGDTDTRGGAALKIEAIKPLLKLPKFKNATKHVFEDNIQYLHDMCLALNDNHKLVGHFVPSEQGY